MAALLRSSVTKCSASATLARLPLLRPAASFRLRNQVSNLPATSRTLPAREMFRRELAVSASMLPLHNAVASARLVSKLPSEPATCTEAATGRHDCCPTNASRFIVGEADKHRYSIVEWFPVTHRQSGLGE